MMEKNRCAWADTDPLLQKYHDEEWGRPVHDDRKHYVFVDGGDVMWFVMAINVEEAGSLSEVLC